MRSASLGVSPDTGSRVMSLTEKIPNCMVMPPMPVLGATGNLEWRTGQEILGFLATAVAELELTVVMVTHDPAAAAFAHRVVFVADGRVAGEMTEPTAARGARPDERAGPVSSMTRVVL